MSGNSRYSTEQEAFWAGEFGAEYVTRNQGDQLIAANISLFAQALQRTQNITSCIEFGANIGLNLRALRALYPSQQQAAIELNQNAVMELRKFLPETLIFHGSIFDFKPQRTFTLSLIKGVLIHINPDHLPRVYDSLYECAERYILIAEYYNPDPVTVSYRGHERKLFKRDFAGEIMDRFPNLRLVDYGFVYRRDPSHPQDDTSWFLLEKCD